MKSSAAKFVLALFATVLAGSPLFAAPETEEKEKPADTCLLGPSASTPPGGHWYYRPDRANKRNCWYLGESKAEGKGKAARKQVAEEDAAPEKPVAAPPKKPAAQRSITDARAEWQSSQTPVEPDSKAAATPWPTAAPVDAQRADEPRKVATTRWPESAAASPPAAAAAPASPAPLAPPQVAQAAQPQTQAQTQAAPAVPPPPRPVAPPPAARSNAAADQPLSLPMLLTVLVAGLSVIGVLVSAMFGRKKSRPTRLSRSAPMPSLEEIPEAPRPQQPRPEQASEHARPEQPDPEQPDPEQARAPDDPNRRLKEMLAEIQRRAAA